MLDVMASFVRQNKAHGIEAATFVRALYRSTQTSADVLGIGEKKGSFGAGKDLDFIGIKASVEQLDANSADAVLENVIAPLEGQRESYESLVLKTVVEGESVFEC